MIIYESRWFVWVKIVLIYNKLYRVLMNQHTFKSLKTIKSLTACFTVRIIRFQTES